MHKSSVDIAIFLRNLYGGGAERVMLNLAQEFIKRGLKIDLVLSNVKGDYLSQLPPEIRVIDLKASSMPKSLPNLIKYLRQERPTTLFAALHYPCEIAILAKRLAGVPTRVVVSEHSILSQEAARIPQLSVKLSPIAAKLLYPLADGIIAVSKGAASDLAKVTGISRERIQVIYNPIVDSKIPLRAKEPVEHPWFQPGQPPVILATGRLFPEKDYPTLIRAFAQIRQVQNARLVILGEGPERPSLENLIRELGIEASVELLGFVENPYAYMARASVFTLSSAYEGLGNVLVEALAVGTPVVSTNCKTGPGEVLDNGKYGTLTPVGDSKALAEAIFEVLSGNTKKVEPSWLEQFAVDDCTEKYLKVLIPQWAPKLHTLKLESINV
ncbi:group 1 glycosyl transferase [Calothrix sp. NIES-4071]|nr:group 1 glycosyl transferase [Calothrix sp. NIES-4071]BAZ63317.1 group 1 glycosyl transferase [Calothrix sp. NIES-4105]